MTPTRPPVETATALKAVGAPMGSSSYVRIKGSTPASGETRNTPLYDGLLRVRVTTAKLLSSSPSAARMMFVIVPLTCSVSPTASSGTMALPRNNSRRTQSSAAHCGDQSHFAARLLPAVQNRKDASERRDHRCGPAS